MGVMPKTGIRTPAAGTNPFDQVFDNEHATDIDNWVDANRASADTMLLGTRRDTMPYYDEQTGTVYWGKFNVLSARYAQVLKASSGSSPIALGECLYMDVPARPFDGSTNAPQVGTFPQTGRDVITLGVLTSSGWLMVAHVPEHLRGFGPGPSLVRRTTGSESIYNSDIGKLIVADQGFTITLPGPSYPDQCFYIKCNGTSAQYVTIAGGGGIGFLGPHERDYGVWTGDMRLYGGGGEICLVAHEQVGVGYGWLVARGTGHLQRASAPAEEWYLDGGANPGGGGGGGFPPADAGITVPVTADPVANGNALIAAVATANALAPTGLQPLRSVCVFCPDAHYDLGSQQLQLTTDLVHIRGFGISRWDATQGFRYPGAAVTSTNGTSVISVTADDIEMQGLTVYNTGSGEAILLGDGGANEKQRLSNIFATTVGGTIGIGSASPTGGLKGSFDHCHSNKSMLRCETFAGIARWCHGGDESFGASTSGTPGTVVVTGEFHDCFAEDRSFGYSDYGSAQFNGYAKNCKGGTYCFGVTRDLGGTASQTGSVAGEVHECEAGDYSFGYEPSGKSTSSFTGEAVRCQSGGYSFAGASNGVFSGRAFRCVGVNDCFGWSLQGYLDDCQWVQVGGKNVAATARLVNCKTLQGSANQSYIYTNGAAHFEGCKFKNANGYPIYIGSGTPHFYNCTLVAGSGVDSIYALGAVNALILHCRLNKLINANVTNLEATPYNVVNNANVTLP